MKKVIPFIGWSGNNPTRIVPKKFHGVWIRVVRARVGNLRFELGYTPGRRVFGHYLRRMRKVLILSMDNTLRQRKNPARYWSRT